MKEDLILEKEYQILSEEKKILGMQTISVICDVIVALGTIYLVLQQLWNV